MRSILGAALALGAVGAVSVACAAVSGLNEFSAGGGDGDGSVTSPPGEAGSTDDSADEPTLPGDDAPGDDGPGLGSDTATGEDGSPPFDAARDGPPPCSPSTCNGCCDSAGCHGGYSVGTCGLHGVVCSNCATHNQACNGGSCGAPPQDASTNYQCTTSNITACASSCAVAIYTPCCKSDHTCGCQWTAFDPACN